MQPCTEEAMMLNYNFTMMNEDESASTTETPSKRMMRTTGPRSFGGMLARVGAGLLLLLLMAEGGAVVMPEEAVAEGALWSDPVSSSPGRQRRVVVGADRASKAAVAEEEGMMTENGHDTTSRRRDDFVTAAAAGAATVVTEDGRRLPEFPRRPETTAAAAEEEDGIEMMEDGSRTHEFSTPRRVNIKNSKKTSQSLAVQQVETKCWDDGSRCGLLWVAGGPDMSCEYCCNGHHYGPAGIETYCGPDPNCWGKGTDCVFEWWGIDSCGKCCNSWHWQLWGGVCG